MKLKLKGIVASKREKTREKECVFVNEVISQVFVLLVLQAGNISPHIDPCCIPGPAPDLSVS